MGGADHGLSASAGVVAGEQFPRSVEAAEAVDFVADQRVPPGLPLGCESPDTRREFTALGAACQGHGVGGVPAVHSDQGTSHRCVGTEVWVTPGARQFGGLARPTECCVLSPASWAIQPVNSAKRKVSRSAEARPLDRVSAASSAIMRVCVSSRGSRTLGAVDWPSMRSWTKCRRRDGRRGASVEEGARLPRFSRGRSMLRYPQRGPSGVRRASGQDHLEIRRYPSPSSGPSRGGRPGSAVRRSRRRTRRTAGPVRGTWNAPRARPCLCAPCRS